MKPVQSSPGVIVPVKNHPRPSRPFLTSPSPTDFHRIRLRSVFNLLQQHLRSEELLRSRVTGSWSLWNCLQSDPPSKSLLYALKVIYGNQIVYGK
ncbi:LOW QUALITY PROTEIN: hypothetical protein YC2023_059320 [Brassica napus]